jgi:hypothetical protein
MTFITDAGWTPATYRKALAVWQANAPKTDSKIMPTIRHAERPSLHNIAGQSRPLLFYRSEPSGESFQTNWRIEPYSGDPLEIANFATDATREYIPSRNEIMRQAAKAVYREVSGIGLVPVGGDFDMQTDAYGFQAVARIGKLRFSDGTQTEKCFVLGLKNAVIRADLRMPVGAMLGCRERLSKKGVASARTSNKRLAELYKVDVPVQKPGRRKKGKRGTSLTADQSRAELAAAIANTPNMPPIKKCPPGLPIANADVGDIFIGLRKKRTGDEGMATWQDQYTAAAEREAYRLARRALADEHRRALDEALTAETLSDVGVATGKTGDYARHAGRRVLIAANDNFAQAMKKFAA